MNKTQSLQNLIDRLISLKSAKKYGSVISELEILKNRISDKTFRIAVVGEFSSGKSTFINAFIGKDVLKHASAETTAAITYIYNVPENDKRYGQCVVAFRNGEKEILPNLEQLREYTTVNESVNVTDKIESVSIYTHFLDCTHPIVLTDTPGLNGIADKHREITLEEIRRSHTCIYLLSNNGVKKSDTDFLKVLLNYQSRFIFLQNFIDTLRTSEGETINKKIQSDRDILDEFFKKANASVKYDVYPVSAIKALAARDLSKEKVYENDIDFITDRELLLDESHFTEFEKRLTEIIDSGEYLDIIAESAKMILLKNLNRLKNGIEDEDRIREELLKADQRTQRINNANRMIEVLREEEPSKRKSLLNFIEAKDIDIRKLIKENVNKQLVNLSNEINKLIDEMIRQFDDIENFPFYHEGKSIEAYYSEQVSLLLNSDVIPKTDNTYRDCLLHLYESAILKVPYFKLEVNSTNGQIDIILDESKDKFSFDNKTPIEDDERKLNQTIDDLKRVNDQLSNSYRDKGSLVNQRNTALMEMQNIELDYRYRIAMLGEMPLPDKKRVEKVRTIERTGILGWIKDLFCDPETEIYYEDQDDYSKQDEWKERKRQLEDDIERKRASCEGNIQYFKERIQEIELNIHISESKKDDLEKNKKYLEKQIELQEENYKNALAISKNEYCDAQKKHLKDNILQSLIGNDDHPGMQDKIVNHIEQMSKKNLPMIKERVLKVLGESYQSRIDSLNAIIQSNNQELETIRKITKEEISKLSQIEKEVKAL